jgi:S1-C subfamily serine protease
MRNKQKGFFTLLLLFTLAGCTAPMAIAPSSQSTGDAVVPTTEAAAISRYFSDRELGLVEGIWTWDDNGYQIAIYPNNTGVEEEYDYVGVIIRTDTGRWRPGQIKILLNSTASPFVFTGVYFGGNQDRVNTSFLMDNRNMMTVNHTFDDGKPILIRDYPVAQGNSPIATSTSESHGTCFVVSETGQAVTSHHVVSGMKTVNVILANGKSVPAIVESSSAANDIAVLRLASATPNFLNIGTSRSLSLGSSVFTIGYPSKRILGSDAKFSDGSISALSGIQGEAAYMQVSMPIQPGNSGGPVVDYEGNVVGIIAATAAAENFYRETGSLPQNVNWAVKSEYLLPMLTQLPSRPRARDRSEAIAMVESAVCQVVATN